MKHHFTVAIVIILTTIASAGASAEGQTPPTDPRIRSLLFVPDQVVRLRGWVGYHVDLKLSPANPS